MSSARAAVENLSFSEERKEFILNVLDPVLQKVVAEVIAKKPEQPTDFMIDMLRKLSGVPETAPSTHLSLQQTNDVLKKKLMQMQSFLQDAASPGGAKPADEEEDDEQEEEEDDDEPDEPPPPPVNMSRQRASVSAEAYGSWNQKKPFDPPKYPKTEEQAERLRSILSRSFMFSALSPKDQAIVVLAMKEASFQPGERIIQEGDDGDFLCLIEAGNPECKKLINGEEKVVKKCAPGDVFGELALLYNARRAASVDATDQCVAWQLDRETFNYIVKDAASKQTGLHVPFLEKVGIFSLLDDYERSQLSDAMKSETYAKDEFVIRQGEEGHSFYVVEEGSLMVLKADDGSDPKEVTWYSGKDFFGELALLKDQPRTASVKVLSDTAKVLSLDRASFKRLLGPLQDMLLQKAMAEQFCLKLQQDGLTVSIAPDSKFEGNKGGQ
ncbi:unnamed protein product [Effrenium voratum]|nr:unnamed protein product [Effrenium voratum]